MSKSIEVISYSAYFENAKLVEVFGQGCNYATCLGVDGFEVGLSIEATNESGDSRFFTVVYQSLERLNNLMAYNGYEMATADQYGCDYDQSEDAFEFMDHDYECLNECKQIAENECKQWLLANVEQGE